MRRNYFLIAALLIVATLMVTLILYPGLPSRIPIHRFAAKAFVVAGLLGLLSLVVSASAIAGLVIIGGAGLASVLYSLAYYKRLERRNQL